MVLAEQEADSEKVNLACSQRLNEPVLTIKWDLFPHNKPKVNKEIYEGILVFCLVFLAILVKVYQFGPDFKIQTTMKCIVVKLSVMPWTFLYKGHRFSGFAWNLDNNYWIDCNELCYTLTFRLVQVKTFFYAHHCTLMNDQNTCQSNEIPISFSSTLALISKC